MKLPDKLDNVQLYPHWKEIEAIIRDCANVCLEEVKEEYGAYAAKCILDRYGLTEESGE